MQEQGRNQLSSEFSRRKKIIVITSEGIITDYGPKLMVNIIFLKHFLILFEDPILSQTPSLSQFFKKLMPMITVLKELYVYEIQ